MSRKSLGREKLPSDREMDVFEYLLSGNEMHAYEMVKKSEGTSHPLSQNIIYTVLMRMVERGYLKDRVEKTEGRRGLLRRYYKISAHGAKMRQKRLDTMLAWSNASGAISETKRTAWGHIVRILLVASLMISSSVVNAADSTNHSKVMGYTDYEVHDVKYYYNNKRINTGFVTDYYYMEYSDKIDADSSGAYDYDYLYKGRKKNPSTYFADSYPEYKTVEDFYPDTGYKVGAGSILSDGYVDSGDSRFDEKYYNSGDSKFNDDWISNITQYLLISNENNSVFSKSTWLIIFVVCLFILVYLGRPIFRLSLSYALSTIEAERIFIADHLAMGASPQKRGWLWCCTAYRFIKIFLITAGTKLTEHSPNESRD